MKEVMPSFRTSTRLGHIHTHGGGHLPITSGVEVPFGLPSARENSITNPVQEPTLPSQSRAPHVEVQLGTSPVDSTSPPPEVFEGHRCGCPTDHPACGSYPPFPGGQAKCGYPTGHSPSGNAGICFFCSESDTIEATPWAIMPADPTFLATQESTSPAHSGKPSIPITPAKEPAQSCGNSGLRKNRRDVPRVCEHFDPFTCRTTPRPLVGATWKRP